MRLTPTLLVFAVCGLPSELLAQETPIVVSTYADQSWMLNPGSRGDGPIDLGTLAGVSAMAVVNPRTGLEFAFSAGNIRPRNLNTGRLFEGRVVRAIGFHLNYFLRPSERQRPRIQPYFSLGAGLLRAEQRYHHAPPGRRPVVSISRENAFPVHVGGGLFAFVQPRVALRAEVRAHLSAEEWAIRLIGGASYLF